MCYGNGCMFQGYMGECTVNFFKLLKFEELYGYKACVVGRALQNKHDEEFYELHKDELDNIYKKYLKDEQKELDNFMADFA